MGKFYGSFVAFAIFIQIQCYGYVEYAGGESSIPMTGHHIHKRGYDDIDVKTNSGMGSTDTFHVQLKGLYYWKRLGYVDNRDRSEPYFSFIPITKTKRMNYSSLLDNVLNAAVKAGLSVDKEGIIDILSLKFVTPGIVEPEVELSYHRAMNFKYDTNFTKETVQEFYVRANSVGEAFQLMYMGPGLVYAGHTVFTTIESLFHNVTINCEARQLYMLQDIKVVLTDQINERPENIITDSFSGSPDINRGYTGKYVWLVPIWTTNKNDVAVTKVKYTIQDYAKEKYVNFGTSNQYRYLEMVRDPSKRRIERVGLLRSSTLPQNRFAEENKYGWDECTTDINMYRVGDALHLCWNYFTV